MTAQPAPFSVEVLQYARGAVLAAMSAPTAADAAMDALIYIYANVPTVDGDDVAACLAVMVARPQDLLLSNDEWAEIISGEAS